MVVLVVSVVLVVLVVPVVLVVLVVLIVLDVLVETIFHKSCMFLSILMLRFTSMVFNHTKLLLRGRTISISAKHTAPRGLEYAPPVITRTM